MGQDDGPEEQGEGHRQLGRKQLPLDLPLERLLFFQVFRQPPQRKNEVAGPLSGGDHRPVKAGKVARAGGHRATERGPLQDRRADPREAFAEGARRTLPEQGHKRLINRHTRPQHGCQPAIKERQ